MPMLRCKVCCSRLPQRVWQQQQVRRMGHMSTIIISPLPRLFGIVHGAQAQQFDACAYARTSVRAYVHACMCVGVWLVRSVCVRVCVCLLWAVHVCVSVCVCVWVYVGV